MDLNTKIFTDSTRQEIADMSIKRQWKYVMKLIRGLDDKEYKPEELPMLNRPKILVIGYGRHGKDTVCEILRDKYGLRFVSSSYFCAERVVWPALVKEYGSPLYVPYETVQDCYDDRHNQRRFWYESIKDYNKDDPSRLAREILEEYDVYCGMRSSEEFDAAKEKGLFDVVAWVDRSHHISPESLESCTVNKYMADHTIDNNGSMDELSKNVDEFIAKLR